jgi:hypothetical protein
MLCIYYLCETHGHLRLRALDVEQHVEAVKEALLHHLIAPRHHAQQLERLLEDDADALVLLLKGTSCSY